MYKAIQASATVVLGLCLASPSFSQDVWIFNLRPDESRFMVKVGRAGVFQVFGHDHLIEVRRYTGQVEWHPDQPEASSIRVEVEAASLTVVDEVDEVEEEERAEIQADMETKALFLDQYPTIRFVSKELSLRKLGEGELRGEVTGELTLHGVKQTIKIPLWLTVTEDKLRSHGEFKLKVSQFGIEQIKAAGGTIKTKDELELSFELVGDRD